MNKWMIWGETPLVLETPIYLGGENSRFVDISFSRIFVDLYL